MSYKGLASRGRPYLLNNLLENPLFPLGLEKNGNLRVCTRQSSARESVALPSVPVAVVADPENRDIIYGCTEE